MEAREPLPFVALGNLLIPRLQEALNFGDLSTIVGICGYLEDMAVGSRTDPMLADLLGIEIGRWLGWVAHEDLLTPRLGPETKQVCSYVPGLATQRLQLKKEKAQRSLKNRLKRIFSRKR